MKTGAEFQKYFNKFCKNWHKYTNSLITLAVYIQKGNPHFCKSPQVNHFKITFRRLFLQLPFQQVLLLPWPLVRQPSC